MHAASNIDGYVGHLISIARLAPKKTYRFVNPAQWQEMRAQGFKLPRPPPAGADPVPHFLWLRDRARRHGLAVLSMGMSADFEAAIGCGATHVRIGTAIFGGRGAAQA